MFQPTILLVKKHCGLSLSHVQVKRVKELLKNLKTSKSTSIDELDNYAVKVSADVIAEPLYHIITLSILQKIIPLHKKECPLQA